MSKLRPTVNMANAEAVIMNELRENYESTWIYVSEDKKIVTVIITGQDLYMNYVGAEDAGKRLRLGDTCFGSIRELFAQDCSRDIADKRALNVANLIMRDGRRIDIRH